MRPRTLQDAVAPATLGGMRPLFPFVVVALLVPGCTLFRAADTPCDVDPDCDHGLVCRGGFCTEAGVAAKARARGDGRG